MYQGDERKRPELSRLLEAYDRGEIEPAQVTLGELPKHAGRDERRVAADLELLLGLRYADGDYRPVPYSLRFCCRRMGWPEDRPMRASRVLARLERWWVISPAGTLGPREGFAYRTNCYAPPSRVDAVKREPVSVEPVGEPLAVVPHELGVAGAQAVDGEHAVGVALGHGAATLDSPAVALRGAPLDPVHPAKANSERGPVWVSTGGSVGHWEYPAGRNQDGEEWPF